MEMNRPGFTLRQKTRADNKKVVEIIQQWGSEIIVSRGKSYSAHNTDGILACMDSIIAGICLYNIEATECEIILLEVFKEKIGIGSAFIEKMKEVSKERRCTRLWLITTNDNIDAIKFYQKKGFYISGFYGNAIEESRKIKPQIPFIGHYQIPIRDEIELEMKIHL